MLALAHSKDIVLSLSQRESIVEMSRVYRKRASFVGSGDDADDEVRGCLSDIIHSLFSSCDVETAKRVDEALGDINRCMVAHDGAPPPIVLPSPLLSQSDSIGSKRESEDNQETSKPSIRPKRAIAAPKRFGFCHDPAETYYSGAEGLKKARPGPGQRLCGGCQRVIWAAYKTCPHTSCGFRFRK